MPRNSSNVMYCLLIAKYFQYSTEILMVKQILMIKVKVQDKFMKYTTVKN